VLLGLHAEPEDEPPFVNSWRSFAIWAHSIGLRANAIATPVASSARSVEKAAWTSGKKGSWAPS